MIRNFLKRIIIRKLPNDAVNSIPSKTLLEEEYYTQLFIESDRWNKPTPNSEEELRWRIIENFIYYIKGSYSKNSHQNLTILDLGCGRGWLTNLMSSHGNIQGIEPVVSVVNYANKLFPHLNISAGLAEDLLEANKKFNLVVSSEVIEHIDNNKKNDFIKDIYNLLQSNGFVIITTPRKEAQTEWLHHLSADQPIEEWLDEATLRNAFEENGFRTHLCERISISPCKGAPSIQIYQLWLFEKK